jgi:hypothetical protein
LPNTIQVIYKQLDLIAHFNGWVTSFFMCCHIKTRTCQWILKKKKIARSFCWYI